MRRRSVWVVVPLAPLLALVPAAASADVVAHWRMNEPRGATTMVDASPNLLDGDIGRRVRTHVGTPSGHGYLFRQRTRGYRPERLVTVPDSARLDPRSGPYVVTVRFRTRADHPNIVQKGQSGQTGGYWKLALHQGWPRCHFRDRRGRTKAVGFVGGASSLQVDDHRWHTVRCARRAAGVRITLDPGGEDAVSKRVRGTLGRIDNTRPFSVGGKLDCAAADVSCDYFTGRIDWIRVDRP